MNVEKKVTRVLPWMMLVMVSASSLLNAFSIIPALLAHYFRVDAATMSWQTVVITLSMGVAGIVYATLADYISIRQLMSVGLALMTGGLLLGFFFSHNLLLVIIASALATLGGQSANALLLVTAVRYLSKEASDRYFGYYSACINAAQLLGVLLGGFLTSWIGWRYLFIFPLISVVTIYFVLKYLPKDSKLSSQKLDIFGISLLTIFTFLLSLFFNQHSWLVLLLAIVVLIGLYLHISHHANAFVSLDFFKNKRYTLAIILGGLVNSLLVAYPFMFSFLCAAIYHTQPLQVSEILIPSYIIAILVATFASNVAKLWGLEHTVLISLALILIGLLLGAAFLESGVWILVISSSIFSGGMALFAPQVQALMFSALPEDKVGVGSGIYGLVFSTSMSLGTAITGTLLAAKWLHTPSIFPFLSTKSVSFSNLLLLFIIWIMLTLGLTLGTRKTLFGGNE
ncbi:MULTISPECIES: MFS transporter [Lactobacillaceae]|uniref:MFS transporter n=1 Tax=Lactobacillaceae TaxID=33958 RepID=UPI001456BC45|nr:MFS transporter [Lactobacillus sp. HBUAS51381]NLR10528.1 MFS transporter [Lactobacillus sp. HBUAS51381]